MRRVLQMTRILILPLLVLAPAGCGKGYKLATVSGRITIDKHPLAGAEVSFFPVDGGKDSPYASGKTDEQGNYKLEAFVGSSTSEGAVVGENRVTIMGANARSGKRPRGMAHTPDEVPAKYNSQSTLSFTILPEGTSEANFDLTSR
jgi:hypothetical protein